MRNAKGQFADSQGKANAHYKHGMFGTTAYWLWRNIKQRCNNPKNKSFKDYGARGIKVCERWNLFVNFYADMGDAPAGMTIERKDNDRGYEPGNCIWADRRTQNRNKRNTKLTLAQVQDILASPEGHAAAGRRYGVTRQTIYLIRKRKVWL